MRLSYINGKNGDIMDQALAGSDWSLRAMVQEYTGLEFGPDDIDYTADFSRNGKSNSYKLTLSADAFGKLFKWLNSDVKRRARYGNVTQVVRHAVLSISRKYS